MLNRFVLTLFFGVLLSSSMASSAPVGAPKHIRNFEHKAYLYSRDFSCAASHTYCGNGWCYTAPSTATFHQNKNEQFRWIENISHYSQPYTVEDLKDPTGKVLCGQIDQLRESDADFPVQLKGFLQELVEKREDGSCQRVLSETISFELKGLSFSSTAQLALDTVPCS